MSLSSALSIALSGLQASTAALTITSNNIANASTAGYTEKSVDLSSVDLGGFPSGVSISGYSRATDQAVSASLSTSTSNASYLSTQYSYMQQIQSILDSTSTNPTLSADMSTFQSDWEQLSSSPESSIMQQTVINDGNKLAKDIVSINAQVTSLQKQVVSDIGTTVSTLNNDLKTVQNLNTQISTALASNQPAVDLEDQRDNAINGIAAITSVTVMQRANGQVALYTPSGTALLDGTAQTFVYNGTDITNSAGQIQTSGLQGGSLQAQLGFIDTSTAAASSTDPGTGIISKIRSQLSTLVNALTGSSSSFASAYSAGVTASTATGGTQQGDTLASSFFTVSLNNGVPDPGSIAVTSSLLNSSAYLPQSNVDAIANSFTGTSDYTASGLSASGVTYSQLSAAILSTFQTATNSLKTLSTDASTQQNYYSTTLSSDTGVNTDSELVTLTTLQNTYAAAAHVISTVNTLLTTLENIGTTG